MRRRINADQAQYNCHFAHHNHPAAADDDDDHGDGGGFDVSQVITTQQMPCSLSGQVDYNDVEDNGWYDDIECDDENDDGDKNEDVFNDDDDDDEACRAQMLTKLVPIARQDARIQQAFDIYDHREDDSGDKGGVAVIGAFKILGEWGLTHA